MYNYDVFQVLGVEWYLCRKYHSDYGESSYSSWMGVCFPPLSDPRKHSYTSLMTCQQPTMVLGLSVLTCSHHLLPLALAARQASTGKERAQCCEYKTIL